MSQALPMNVVPLPKPDPLPEREIAPAYPVDALGGWLSDAALAIAEHVQLPLSVAAQTVLSVASLVTQGHITVKRGHYSGHDPVSLYFMSILESGDRKSSADKIALKPVRDFEQKQRELFRESRKRFESEQVAWDLRRKSIEDSFKPKKQEQISEAKQQELAQLLTDHETKRPVSMNDPSMLMSEPTAEGIFWHLKNCSYSSGLFNDEAVGFFGGHGMTQEARGRTISLICKIWDSGAADKSRAQFKEHISGRRLTAHLMMQPVIAADVLGDPLLRDQGFLPRFLVVAEPSMAGTRFISNRGGDQGAYSDPRITRYFTQVERLLNDQLQPADSADEGLIFHHLELEGEALDAWRLLHDGIESELHPEGRYYGIKGFGSKAAEQAARIAAILSRVEGRDTIDPGHVQRAGKLVAYYLESMLAQTNNAAEDQERIEARELLEWIRRNGGTITSAEFKRLPMAYRSAKKARALLEELDAEGYIEVSDFGRNGRSRAWKALAGGAGDD